jgi:hypothetical protein
MEMETEPVQSTLVTQEAAGESLQSPVDSSRNQRIDKSSPPAQPADTTEMLAQLESHEARSAQRHTQTCQNAPGEQLMEVEDGGEDAKTVNGHREENESTLNKSEFHQTSSPLKVKPNNRVEVGRNKPVEHEGNLTRLGVDSSGSAAKQSDRVTVDEESVSTIAGRPENAGSLLPTYTPTLPSEELVPAGTADATVPPPDFDLRFEDDDNEEVEDLNFGDDSEMSDLRFDDYDDDDGSNCKMRVNSAVSSDKVKPVFPEVKTSSGASADRKVDNSEEGSSNIAENAPVEMEEVTGTSLEGERIRSPRKTRAEGHEVPSSDTNLHTSPPAGDSNAEHEDDDEDLIRRKRKRTAVIESDNDSEQG